MSLLTPRARRIGQLLLVITLTSVSLPVRAQDSPELQARWDQLLMAAEGTRLKVTFRDGTDLRARLVVAREDALVLDEIQTGPKGITLPTGTSLKGGLTLQRADIASLDILSTPHLRPTTATSFDQLRVLLAPGQRVNVTDASGARVSGKVVTLSSRTLALNVGDIVRELSERDVARIRQRRGDSLGNGALWGTGVGVGFAMMTCGRCHVAIAAAWGGIGAGIGAGLDALIKSEVTVFQRSRAASSLRVGVTPQLAKSHKGVTVSVGF